MLSLPCAAWPTSEFTLQNTATHSIMLSVPLQHIASCCVYHCNTQHHVECTLCVHDAVFCSVGCTASCWVYLVRHGRRADFTRLRFLLEEALRDIRPDVARQIDEDRVDPPRITPVVSRMRLECHTCVPTMSQFDVTYINEENVRCRVCWNVLQCVLRCVAVWCCGVLYVEMRRSVHCNMCCSVNRRPAYRSALHIIVCCKS